MGRFEGKTVLVTGAGRNIGREIALDFAREGAAVAVCDVNAENAESTVREIEALGVPAFSGVFDVRDREAVFAFTDAVLSRFGRIDVLVNNAGGSAALLHKLTRFADAEAATLDFVIDTNLKGSMHFAQAVLRSMIPQRSGKIISISSIAALCGLYDRVDYAAAKAALIGMSRALAMEVGVYNICVNCVSPGAIARGGHVPEHMTFLGETGHGGTPRDIAEAVLFLASQDYITGQNLVVDGGRTLGPGSR